MTHNADSTINAATLRHDAGTRRLMIGGGIAIAALFGGFGGWATFAKVRSAVMASGTVVVEGAAQQVQHAEGGIIGQLLVKEGDNVAAGQVLIRLDSTTTKAELEILQQRLFDMRLRRARLIAQRDNADKITFAKKILAAIASRPELASQLAAQRRILSTNRARIGSQLGQIDARVAQLRDEITGLQVQQESKNEEIVILKNDLKRYSTLDSKRLISKTRLNERQRMYARTLGERGRIMSSIARAKGQISEMQIRAAEMKTSSAGEVLKELNEVGANIAELAQREISALDRLSRIEIRAPQGGVIHELVVHTVGGVIAPRDVLMKIVPMADRLIVEAKIATTDIDQVQPGKAATLRFSAFSQRTTPELAGTVTTVSPDQSIDPNTGVAYYTVRLRLSKGERIKLADKILVPGMPAEVMMTGDNRTVLSYLVKPLADQLSRAFRES